MEDNTFIKKQNNKTLYYILISMFLCILSLTINLDNIKAASNLKLYNYSTKKNFTYTGKPVNVTYNGKKVDNNKFPGIILDNTSMVSYHDIFVKSDIKATYKYDKSKATVTLTKNNNTLILKIGSKTATLNGKNIKLPVAPVKIKYRDSNVAKVLVPANIVVNSLGYKYVWNNSTVTSEITSIEEANLMTLSYNGGSIFNYTGTLGDVYYENKKINLGSMPTIIYENTAMLRANKIFASAIGADYKYSSNKKITLKLNDNELIMTVGSKNASLNGKSVKLEAAPMVIKNHNTDASYVFVPGRSTANYLGLNYSWNASAKSSYISTKEVPPELGDESTDKGVENIILYNNISNGIEIGTNSLEDFITFKDINSDNIIINKNENQIYIDIINQTTNTETIDIAIEGAKLVAGINTIESSELSTSYIITIKEEFDYYISQSEQEFSIIIRKARLESENIITSNGTTLVTIPLPDGISANNITDTDMYLSNQFIIKMSGDHTSFYYDRPINSNISNVKEIDVSYNLKNETEITFNTNKILGYKYYIQDNNLILEIGQPDKIYKNIVVLDPGHGGSASGATYNNVKEKDITYKILYTYGKTHFSANDAVLKTYYTRIDDSNPSLYERADFAEELGADMFVSLHMNAAPGAAPGPNGTEVYYSNNNNKTNSSGLNSSTLANMFVKNITKEFNLSNRGIKPQQYVVVHKNSVPAVLVELAFMTNSSNFKFMTNDSNQRQVAEILYKTVIEAFDMYPTGR